ncbi:MAG: hypothetical protein ACRCYY_17665 [Trueperaceae bacterium]
MKYRQGKFCLVGFVLLCVSMLQAQGEQAQKILEQYRPVLELSQQVAVMLELEKSALTLTAEQAALALPILETLQTSETLTNDEATAYKQQFEEEILTAEQREWMATKTLEMQEAAQSNRPAGGNKDMAKKLQNGEPVNLVKDGPSKEALTELIDLLTAKTTS